MAATGQKLHIHSEDDAWQALEGLLKEATQSIPDGVEFDGWPSLVIKIEDGSSIITAPIMNGLLEYQRSLYRVYVVSRYARDDLRKITNEEKDDIEVKFHITAGSTGISADMGPIIDALADVVRNKMEIWHLLIFTIVAALSYTSTSMFRSFMQYRRDSRLSEISSKEKKDHLEYLQYASVEDTKRISLIVDAITAVPTAAALKQQSENANAAILESFAKTRVARYGDVVVNGSDAEELVKSTRRKALDIELSGDYKVISVDTTPPDGFRVRLQNASTDEVISAIMSDAGKYAKDMANVKDAEWAKGKYLLSCNIEGRMLEDGELVDARIMSADLKQIS